VRSLPVHASDDTRSATQRGWATRHQRKAGTRPPPGLELPAPSGAAGDGPHAAAGTLQLRAARDIAAGEPLTVAYLDVDLPAALRQERLAFGYGFACSCQRCQEEL